MEPAWRTVFGHDDPYGSQVDGIETAVEVAESSGFAVIEGACGTGKTMLALTAGIDRVRDPDSDFERVVVLTSVKQQLRQFETDLRAINDGLPEDWRPVSGLTLVGKADVCPYSRENAGGIDSTNVYDRCESLRDRTRSLVGDGGSTTAGALAAEARSQQVGLADSGGGGAQYLETAGEPAPYPPSTPEHDDVEFCPFYAGYLEDLPEDGDPVEAVPFDFTERGMIDTEELVGLAVEHGTCPHSVMGALVPEVEVVVGNYYHAFDPTTTGAFTGALLDESTFLICDEAHMLEPRVRELVSDGVGDATLRDAESELARVIQAVDLDSDTADADLVRTELEESDVTLEECKELRRFVADLREELDRRIDAFLDREHPGWRADPSELPDEEIPLRDPETPEPDMISEWAREAGYDGGTWVRARSVGAVVERILDETEEGDETRSDSADSSGGTPRGDGTQRATPAVGRLLGAWYQYDHERYFREIELERGWDETEPEESWRRAYSARLALHNCVPGDVIGERLGEFGGGVLMSATLEPLDVFREVTGLDRLSEKGRPVVERTYPLAFPEENRASFAVDAPKFTYENRGTPGEVTRTRQLYGDLLRDVAGEPGNVLVGMPNYAEAEWAAAHLRERLSKPVLLDESSGDDATEALKREFFADGGKVLVTSLRGTLTEGVDYRGDRLSAAVVCGVPIINTASPRTRAVRTAYDRVFGNVPEGTSGGQAGASASAVGFEYALTVPAVRKARQAIGRVIRGPEEVGVRVLLDARYARESWDGVREYLPEAEREEFRPVSPDMLSLGLERFRDRH